VALVAYLVAEGGTEFGTATGVTAEWGGGVVLGGYLVAEGGTEFGTATGLLQNGEVE
jgi:hypothetical protein